MAQVLAPIVQTSGTITMLHSSSDAFPNSSAPQPHSVRSSQMARSQVYNTQSGGTGYRGTAAPIAPYAFQSTPQLRQDAPRSTSAPTAHTLQMNSARLAHQTHASSSSESTASTSGSSSRSTTAAAHYVPASKDDSMIGTSDMKKLAVDLPVSSINLSASVPDLSLSVSDTLVKPSPNRYRPRRGDSGQSVAASTGSVTPTQQSPLIGSSTTAGAPKPVEFQVPTRPGHNRASSVDDMNPPRQGSVDQAKRYRRRSLSNFEAASELPSVGPVDFGSLPAPQPHPNQELPPVPSPGRQGSRPNSSQGHERQGSAGSASSTGSARPSSASSPNAPASSSRGTTDARRVMTPSPLSNPIQTSEQPSPAKPAKSQSAAVNQLSALNDKDGGRGMKSRLRRAFSFGSAAELRRASAQNNLSAERARLRKDRYETEQDAEQAAIIAKQEASGIGAGIYNGQGGFSGSNDNLSISSTASSASIMLRKMGSGMKKGGRSIKGLFRPKSVIGVPAADGPVFQPSMAQVSMVTVEAERQKVNVNADPREQVGGGTGYPRLERNSLDAERSTDPSRTGSPSIADLSRKSIVGGDRERAEVLSSMKKKSILKRANGSETPSPIGRPGDFSNESPRSSAPSTPENDHIRQPQVRIGGDDYFGQPPRLTSNSTRSLPNTPQTLARSIAFSPRLQFHEAWSSSEYDRRGDIATCNRLTPTLAQQIKEELNSFKMEMEVHELSKPHTHFF